ncbi:hypothetical protein [Vibrio mediterranei]|uniref:hypothetical protein n=1 Tax=Vibrio mediterranei TaxID=689 RepID=UPI002284286F|nr:hypothetical protein [Vibrio mediterranei]MCY9855105.1 hypothetical protein [Vibrio mediterranei]
MRKLTTIFINALVIYPIYSEADLPRVNSFNCNELFGIWMAEKSGLVRDLDNLSEYSIQVDSDGYVMHFKTKNNRTQDVNGRVFCDVGNNKLRFVNWQYTTPFYLIKYRGRYFGCDDSINYNKDKCIEFKR